MALNLSVPNPTEPELRPRITVVGVGGAGGNAVNNMIRANLEGVEFVVTNTDAQALSQSLASRRIQLGNAITRGLGAGSRPEVGRAAAEEAIEEILEQLGSSNMVFITAGMGGGTGTGAAPVLARAAREHGILTVGVVTKPFQFEGAHRMKLAEAGIQDLQQYVDTLIVIPNQNLFRVANERTTFADAFKMADEVLHSGVRGVTDLMIMPGLINLDFADIRAVMSEMGKAMMGAGDGSGERRALDAAEAAISNPLLDDTSMKGARGVLINITGGMDMTLFEVDEAANRIRDEVDPDANIIFGSTFDPSMDGRMRVSVVATGIDIEANAEPRQRPQISLVMDRSKPTFQPGAGGGLGTGAMAHVVSGAVVQGGFTGGAPTMSAGGHGGGQGGMTMGSAQPMYQTHGAAAVANALQMAADDSQVMARSHAPKIYTEAPQRPQMRPSAPSASDGPFIAPRPVEADATPMQQPVQPSLGTPRGGQPDAFGEAAVVNPPREAPRQSAPPPRQAAAPAPEKKSLSLFERVTGAGRRLTGGGAPAEPKQHPGQNEPRLGAAPVTPPPAAPAATSYGGPDRMAGSPNDDLLDIPAFLRRQAN